MNVQSSLSSQPSLSSRLRECLKRQGRELEVMAHTVNPSTLEAGAIRVTKFKTNLLYGASSRGYTEKPVWCPGGLKTLSMKNVF